MSRTLADVLDVRARYRALRAEAPGARPTWLLERLLLVQIIVCLPLEPWLPEPFGVSFLFLWFAALGLFVAVVRFRELLWVALQPASIAAVAFVAVALVVELCQPSADLVHLRRIAAMLLGAIVCGALIRDRPSLRACCAAFVATGLCVSVFVVVSSLRELCWPAALPLDASTELRERVFADMLAQGADLNVLGLISVQGAIVAIASAHWGRSFASRVGLSALAAFGLVGAALTMSRGAIGNALISCGVLGLAAGRGRWRTMIVLAAILGATYYFLPRGSGGSDEGLDARARLYLAAASHVGEYAWAGVGAGNFWSAWGFAHGFAIGDDVFGAHNVLLQVWIYWGIVPLLAFTAWGWFLLRALPTPRGTSALRLCVHALAASTFVYLLVACEPFAKHFSVGFGILLGAGTWVWPRHAPTANPRSTTPGGAR